MVSPQLWIVNIEELAGQEHADKTGAAMKPPKPATLY